MLRRNLLALLVAMPATGVTAACADPTEVDDPVDDPVVTQPAAPPAVARLVPASPVARLSYASASLDPAYVIALDSTGQPVAGVSVNFTVVTGGGQVPQHRSTTDGRGRATAGRWQLAEPMGEHILIAWVDGVAAAFLAHESVGVAAFFYRTSAAPVSADATDTLLHRVTLFEDGRLSARVVVRDAGTLCTGAVISCIRYPQRRGTWVTTPAGFLLHLDSAAAPVAATIRGDTVLFDGPGGGGAAYVLVPPPTLGPLYERAMPHSFPAGAHSRYLFFENAGRFVLQYQNPVWGTHDYPGRFIRSGDTIDFHFEGWSVAGPWEATGTLRGDSLIVSYNSVMSWSDFEDGAYVRPPASPASGGSPAQPSKGES
jgi:hypothetical protein